MSAICGIYHLDGQPVSPKTLRPVLTEMSDYGRDGTYYWQDGRVALGHQMTWQTPESKREMPPQFDAKAGLAIAADARIDNRRDLCGALGIAGRGRSLTDSRLILQAYRKWGASCPEKLLGDFAFAIWDEQRYRLFCARDILGARQLYYHRTNRRFLFASDVAALRAAPGVRDDLDLSYLSAHFRHAGNYPHDTHTFLADVRKLARAHAMTVDAGGTKTWSYWNPERLPDVRHKTDDDYAAALGDLLDKSVRARVRSAYPVGAHLSGGLDSSSLAVLAARALRDQGHALTGFSWSPPPGNELPEDERCLVEQARRRERIPIHYSTATFADNAANRLKNPANRQGAGFVHEVLVRRQAAAEGIRVILSGWGGDELIAFNGRGYFAELLLSGDWLRLLRETRMQTAIFGGRAWRSFIVRAVYPLLPDWIFERFHPKALPAFWDESPLPDLFEAGFNKCLRRAVPLPRKQGRTRVGSRAMQLGLLAHGHLTQRIEGWAAAGGRMGITYAYPLLDRRIVEFALGLPPEMFFKNGWKRFLFRHASRGILPDEVRWARHKKEPALNADRDRIRNETIARLPRIIAELIKARGSYRVLDAARARHVADGVLAHDHNPSWRPGEPLDERMTQQVNLQNSFMVEMMVNPELEQDAKQCLRPLSAEGTIGKAA